MVENKRKLLALLMVGVIEIMALVLAFYLALETKLTAEFASIATVVAGGGAVSMLAFAAGNAVEHWAKG